MRRSDNDGSASRGYPDRPRLDRLLPDIVLENAPAAVVEAAQIAREKVARWQQAQAEAMEARRTAEQAPADDRAAERQAFDAGRKLPARTTEKRQQEHDAAQRTLALAQRAAREAIDEQDRVVEAHKAEVVGTFQNTLAARHVRMLELVDQLAGETAGFDAEAGIIAAVHFTRPFPKASRRGRLAQEVDKGRRGGHRDVHRGGAARAAHSRARRHIAGRVERRGRTTRGQPDRRRVDGGP